jgi:hypothetical protein
MIDRWDTPREEMSDVAASLGGAVVWIAIAAGVGLFAIREFAKRYSALAEVFLTKQPELSANTFLTQSLFPTVLILDTSPLRI